MISLISEVKPLESPFSANFLQLGKRAKNGGSGDFLLKNKRKHSGPPLEMV